MRNMIWRSLTDVPAARAVYLICKLLLPCGRLARGPGLRELGLPRDALLSITIPITEHCARLIPKLTVDRSRWHCTALPQSLPDVA